MQNFLGGGRRKHWSVLVYKMVFHDFTYAWTWDPLDIILLRALIPERKRPNPELFLSEWKCWKKIGFVKKSIFQVLHLWFWGDTFWFLRRHLWFLKTENLREDLFQFYLFGMTFFNLSNFLLKFFFWDSPQSLSISISIDWSPFWSDPFLERVEHYCSEFQRNGDNPATPLTNARELTRLPENCTWP